MAQKNLILPFLIKATNEKEDLSYPAELACVAYMAESERKKTSFLRNKPEKISFISKLYYPLWAVPVDNSCLIIDGLSNSTYEFTYQEPIKTGTIVEELKKNSISPEKFMDALQAQVRTIKEFSLPVNSSFKAIVNDTELLNFLTEYFQSGKLQTVGQEEKAALIPAEIDEETATETTQAFANALRTMQADAKGLQYALLILKEEVEFHKNALGIEVEKLKEKCEQEISFIKPSVDKNLKNITQKHDKALTNLQRTAERKVVILERRREIYLRKLQTVEQKKNAAQNRANAAKKKKAKSSLGSYEINRYEREINNTKKEINALSDAIDKLKKEATNNLKQKEKEFNEAIAQEEGKITQINNTCASKTALKHKQIEELTKQAATLTTNLENRIDDLKKSGATLRTQVEIAWKTDDLEEPILVQLPIYVMKYAKGKEEERYSLLSPIIISEETSLINGFKKILSSEPKIKTVTRLANKKLHDRLSANVTQKSQSDPAFQMKLGEICRINNSLNLNTFPQTLNEGLDEIEKKGWMTSEEASTVCRRVMGEEA